MSRYHRPCHRVASRSCRLANPAHHDVALHCILLSMRLSQHAHESDCEVGSPAASVRRHHTLQISQRSWQGAVLGSSSGYSLSRVRVVRYLIVSANDFPCRCSKLGRSREQEAHLLPWRPQRRAAPPRWPGARCGHQNPADYVSRGPQAPPRAAAGSASRSPLPQSASAASPGMSGIFGGRPASNSGKALPVMVALQFAGASQGARARAGRDLAASPRQASLSTPSQAKPHTAAETCHAPLLSLAADVASLKEINPSFCQIVSKTHLRPRHVLQQPGVRQQRRPSGGNLETFLQPCVPTPLTHLRRRHVLQQLGVRQQRHPGGRQHRQRRLHVALVGVWEVVDACGVPKLGFMHMAGCAVQRSHGIPLFDDRQAAQHTAYSRASLPW